MKTLLMLKDKILGFSEESLQEGDIIAIPEYKDPLVVRLLQDDLSEREFNKIAYLAHNDAAIKKVNNKKISAKLEKQMAKTLKGHTTPGSGAFNGHKGDVKSKEWLGEHKYTDEKEYRLMRRIWDKIKDEAWAINKTPILEVILDQSNKCLRLMFLDIRDFQSKTDCTEEEFDKLFQIQQYKIKLNSIALKLDDIEEFFDAVVNISEYKLPGLFLTFKDGLTLFGIKSHHFEQVFND